MTAYELDFTFGSEIFKNGISMSKAKKMAKSIGESYLGAGNPFDCIFRDKKGDRIQKDFFQNL